MNMANRLLCVSLVGLGCGGGAKSTPATATTPAKPPVAEGEVRVATTAQLKLGHFTTADGMHGFVLDRTGAAARLKLDGAADIIELTMEEDRERGGELRGYRFVDPENKQRIYITTGGGLIYFHGGDEFRVTFDRDAQPLGSPTVAGKPAKPTPLYEKRGAALAPIAVRTRFSTFTTLDASKLDKVAEAFDKADASMFVRYKDPGKDGWRAYLTVTPSEINGIGYGAQDYATDDDEDKRHTKLAKHGAIIRGYSSPESMQGNHVIVRKADNTSLTLQDGMPGLIWEVNGTTAVFVAIDGGRYHVDISQEAEAIEKGAGPDSKWPKPAADTYADLTMISALAKAGAGGDQVVAEIEKVDGEWNACVVKGWKGAQAKIDTGKLSVGQIKAEIKKLHKGCNKHMDAMETVIVRWIEARTKARLDVHAKAAVKAKAAP